MPYTAVPIDRNAADERFVVHSSLDILGILRALRQRRELVTVYFGPGEFMLSIVLDVDAAARRVVLDGSRDAAVNARVVQAGRITVASQLEQIRVRFEVADVTMLQDGAPALAGTLPTTLTRLQRRDFFRVRLPSAEALRCEVPALVSSPRGPVLVDARVVDISSGGLRLAELPLSVSWQPGTVHEACRIALPYVGVVLFDLEVIHLSHEPLLPDVRGCHVGVQFVSLREATRMRIQQFVNEAQRRQLAACAEDGADVLR